jgi:hypothetical protein
MTFGADYDLLVSVLDELLDAGGADETDTLAVLVTVIGDLIAVHEALQ